MCGHRIAAESECAMTVRVLLVDDHTMFRQALCNLLRFEADLEVVGQTGDGLEVLKLTQATAPDLVCMDINLPGLGGVAVTRDLLTHFPKLMVVALSAHFEKRHVQDMLDAGATAYVTKTEASDELLHAIRKVSLGQTYLCPEVAPLFASKRPPSNRQLEEAAEPLGPREEQVLKMVAEGLTSTQIGNQLHIAVSTVEVHRRNIMRKLKLHSVAELTRYVLSRESLGRFLP
jgi:two-component system NarL family response regulator